MSATATFERFLPTLLDLALAPPAVGVDAARGRRRVHAEFGDFAGHVPYTPGADLRFLDWNALARSGQRVLRRFDAVEHRRLELVIDASGSMEPRMPGVRRLAQVFVFLALHRLDSVELTVLAGDETNTAHFEGVESWPRARDALDEIRAGGTRGVAELGDVMAGKSRGAGRVLVSDFQPEAAVDRVLSRCGHTGHRLVCVFPRLAGETSAGAIAAGPCRLRDAETGQSLEVTMTQALFDAFLAEQRAWEHRMQACCRELGHELVAADLPDPEGESRVESWLPFLAAGWRR